MKLTVIIPDKVVNRIIILGSKNFSNLPEPDKEEYFALINQCGYLLFEKIFHK